MKNIVEKIDDLVQIKNILISVSDKSGLGTFIPDLLKYCPNINIYSTGGTYNHISTLLDKKSKDQLIQISDYTGQPETQGGLVKTLDFKIYLGILTEKYNDSHQTDIARTNAVPIDMVIVNLYPFQETVKDSTISVEKARSEIDIGGPTMIRASAKNFLRVASVVDSNDYPLVIRELKNNNGYISLDIRYTLSKKAFEHTASYDRSIADYLVEKNNIAMRKSYKEIIQIYFRRQYKT